MLVFPYRTADVRASFGNVLVTCDQMNAFGGYAVLVKEVDGWHIYADGLAFSDAIGTAENCASVNRKHGGRPGDGYEE